MGRQRAKRTTAITAVAVVVVLCGLGPRAYDYMVESRLIAELDSEETREEAARELAERGSLRALPRLLELAPWVPRSFDEPFDPVGTILDRGGSAAVALVAAALRSENADVRREAVMGLSESFPFAVSHSAALRAVLDDPDRCVRNWAAYALWELGEEERHLARVVVDGLSPGRCDFVVQFVGEFESVPEAALQALVQRVRTSDEPGDSFAESALLRIGSMSVPAILTLLSDTDPRARRRGAQLLADLGPDSAKGVDPLLALLGDIDGEVRLTAITALGAIGPRAVAAVPRLVPILDTGTMHYATEAAIALGRIGEGACDAVPALVRALADDYSGQRAAAAEALGRVGADPATTLDSLRSALDDGWPTVRAMAAKGLFHLGVARDDVVARLREMVRLDEPPASVWAAAALVKLASGEAEAYVSAITSALRTDLENAAWALELLGDVARSAGPALVDVADIADDWRPCVRALCSVGVNEAALGRLLTPLSDEYPQTSRAPLVIEALGSAAAPLAPDLVAGLRRPEADVRVFAAECLGAIGPPAAEGVVEGLRRLLGARERAVRAQAWRSLQGLLGRRFYIDAQSR